MTADDRTSSTSPGKGEVGREADGRGFRFKRTIAMTAKARRLRSDMTEAEQKLWKALRRNQVGASFRRQHPVGNYVLDFYCPSARLAIEVDGGQHASDEEIKRDRLRTDWLAIQDVGVLRFWNNDLLSNLDGVLQTICTTLNQRMTPSRRQKRADLPLPGGGEKAAS